MTRHAQRLTPAQTEQLMSGSRALEARSVPLDERRALVLAPEQSPSAFHRWHLQLVSRDGERMVMQGTLPLKSLEDLDAVQAALVDLAAAAGVR